MPRYRMDKSVPTISCCGTSYELRDATSYCDECGAQFDWMDALQYWNPEDYMTVLDDDLIQELDLDLSMLGIDPDDWGSYEVDDADIPAWAYDDVGKNGEQLELTELIKDSKPSWQEDLDSYLGLPFDGKNGNGGHKAPWGGPARPPTAHLARHHAPRKERPDPFFVAIPDEVL